MNRPGPVSTASTFCRGQSCVEKDDHCSCFSNIMLTHRGPEKLIHSQSMITAVVIAKQISTV